MNAFESFAACLRRDRDHTLNTRALRLLANLTRARASGDPDRIAQAEELERQCRAEIARRKALR